MVRLQATSSFLLFLSLLLPFPGGCGGPSAEGSSAPFRLLLICTSSGLVLPAAGVALNEAVHFDFSAPVDPETVSSDSIQIRLVSSGFTVAAPGEFTVEGARVTFLPLLPSLSSLEDAGLRSGEEYRILLPGFPSRRGVHSVRGRFLVHAVEKRMRTRETPPLTVDPVLGRPRVLAVGVDLDFDGVFAVDGDFSTLEDEEFDPAFPELPLFDAPVGLARKPVSIAFFISEPVVPCTLEELGRGEDPPFELRDLDRNVAIPSTVVLDQRSWSGQSSIAVRLVITAKTTLPAASRVRVHLGAKWSELGGAGKTLEPLSVEFVTRAGPDRFSDALIEKFVDRENAHAGSTARWAVDQPGLSPGSNLGGSGADGALVLQEGDDLYLEGGVYQFSRIHIPRFSRLVATGRHPLRIFCQQDGLVIGDLILDGSPGRDGSPGENGLGTPGGRGHGGGGGGGKGAPLQIEGEGIGEGTIGSLPGGEAGLSDPSFPGGGGGGGHVQPGESGWGLTSGGGAPALGGFARSGTTGGSGGGGGGAGGDEESIVYGGGGGGSGGGALFLSLGGRLEVQGCISTVGGRGGDGAVSMSGSGGGGGGGGAAGSLRLRARSVGLGRDARLLAVGGFRGRGGGGGARPGGGGGEGSIAILAIDENKDDVLGDPELFIEAASAVTPRPWVGALDPGLEDRSFAEARFLDTGTGNPRFSFDGTDPFTGIVKQDPVGTDLELSPLFPADIQVRILFQAAMEDPKAPGQPDPDSVSRWTPMIEELSGCRFIRFRVEFEQARPAILLERSAALLFLRIRFEFEID